MLHTPDPYIAYSYAYPHKTAYRFFDTPRPLSEVWAGENREALFLYLHIPFCEMRCGFCNLFTTANPDSDLEKAYLETLRVQAERVRDEIGAAGFARMAIGGGTPTYLAPDDLHRLFDIAAEVFGVPLGAIPLSVETSPHTADAARLDVLRARGVTRLSIGVQSFLEEEARAVGRPQKSAEVHSALERIRARNFPVFNLDLIYGIPGQTVTTWLESLRAALLYAPEEIYLYPLYTRPLTGLDRMSGAPVDERLTLYRAGRDFLLAAGYEQISMRMFRATHVQDIPAPVYCCQDDGMVGLGCGARSYTRTTHYSSEYGVSRQAVMSILKAYLARPAESFAAVHYGFDLDGDEQRRRYLIMSLLQAEGLALAAYRARFGGDVLADFPQLDDLTRAGLADLSASHLRLTPDGLERSDAIGPALYSPRVAVLSEAYELR